MSQPSGAAAVLPFPVPRVEGTSHLGRAQKNEARLFALTILRDPEYQAATLAAARRRELPPAIEQAIMHYGWGKPVAQMEVGAPGAFASELEELSTSDLAARAELLAATLRAMPTAEQKAAAAAAVDILLPPAEPEAQP